VGGADGRPLAGAAVRVTDRSGAAVYSGTTGADGTVQDVVVVTTVYRQTTSDRTKITTDARGPFDVSASMDGAAVSEHLDSLAGQQDVDLTLSL